jgi:hypothetical protein
MRVCPKCDYHDPDYWRPSRYRFDVDYCYLQDLKDNMPALYEKLRFHDIVCEGIYAYWVCGRARDVVLRVWRPLYEQGGKEAFHMRSEKVDRFVDPFQKKLEEVVVHEKTTD